MVTVTTGLKDLGSVRRAVVLTVIGERTVRSKKRCVGDVPLLATPILSASRIPRKPGLYLINFFLLELILNFC